MKLVLPILINQRRNYYLDLVQNTQNDSDDFVISIPDIASTISLLSIDKTKKVRSLEVGGGDMEIRSLSAEVRYRDGRVILGWVPNTMQNFMEETQPDNEDWKLAPAPKPEVTDQTPNSYLLETFAGASLKYKEDSRRLEVYLEIMTPQDFQAEHSALSFEFSYKDPKNTYMARSQMHLASSTELFQLAMDFGSEASQIKHKFSRLNLGLAKVESKQENLFTLMKNYQSETERGEDYLQYDPKGPFYKSVFYASQDLGTHNPLGSEYFFPTDSRILELMTTKSELSSAAFNEQYHRLPNLKLAHRHSNSLANYNFQYDFQGQKQYIDFDELKEKIYASILSQLSHAYLYDIRKRAQQIYLRFSILIPNIYGGIDLRKTKNILKKVMSDIENHPNMPMVRGYEILTISESDASYMGYYGSSAQQPQAGKYYLIIDCGKGTTDFSILKTQENNPKHFVPVYRNGFAGAGNLISYAYFQAALEFLISQADEPTEAKEAYTAMLSNLSDNQSYRLFDIIEKWKYGYHKSFSQQEIAQSWKEYQQGDITIHNVYTLRNLDSILVFLQGLSTCADWGGYIADAIDYIGDQVKNNLSTVQSNMDNGMRYGGVLFTGRAFLYRPLYDKLQRVITELGLPPEKIEELLSAEKLKSVCVDGVLRENIILNAEMIGIPIQVSWEEEDEEVQSIEKDRWSDKIKRWVARFVDGSQFDVEANEMKIDSSMLAKSKFIMSDSYYSITNPFFSDTSNYSSMDFIFTNDNYYFRAKDAQGHIVQIAQLGDEEEIGFIEKKQIMASLFPAFLDTETIAPLHKTFQKIDKSHDDFQDFLPQ